MEIIYQGYHIPINENLLNEMNAWERLGDIIKARIAINGLMLDAKSAYENNALTRETGHVIVNAIERMEFKLQEAWGFPQDASYHSYQDRLCGCTCPWLDNRERYGVDQRIVSGDCPYHSKGE